MKKKRNKAIILLLILCIGIILFFFLKKETVKGVIVSVNKYSITIIPNEGEDEYYPGVECLILVKAKNPKINFSQYQIGQTVIIEYDGVILESYPEIIKADKIKGGSL